MGPLCRIVHLSLTRMGPTETRAIKYQGICPRWKPGASAGIMNWGTQIEKMGNIDATQMKCINQHPIMARIKPESQKVWAQVQACHSLTFWLSLKIPNLSEPQTFIWKMGWEMPMSLPQRNEVAPGKVLYNVLFWSGFTRGYCSNKPSPKSQWTNTTKISFPHSPFSMAVGLNSS